MKCLLSIVGIFVVIVGTNSQNIAVKTEYGTGFVEPDNLLESALMVALQPRGIFKVDVNTRNHDNSYFKIEIKTNGMLESNFENTLQQVLRNDLGLTGAKVTARNDWFYEHHNERKFYVMLDPNSSKRQLEALAQRTMKSTYLKLRNDPW